MSKDSRYIVRRTISQERFEVLWKKRLNDKATLRDLTEMDEIINRDPSVRQFVLEEMESMNAPVDNNHLQDMLQQPVKTHHSFTYKIKSFFNRLFNSYSATNLSSANG